VRVLAAVESVFGVALTLERLFDHPTVGGFADQIEQAVANVGSEASRVPANEAGGEHSDAEAKGAT
jgi:hypothetical protein